MYKLFKYLCTISVYIIIVAIIYVQVITYYFS